MKKKLYAAYGSNLNIRQMAHRCPGAKLLGTGIIPGYELQFKGHDGGAFATIFPKEEAEVPVAVWELKQGNESALDRYEGYPSHYFKRDVPVQMNGQELSVMAYIMDLRMDFGAPSPWYYEVVKEGYRDCGLDQVYLKNALEMSVQNSPSQFCAWAGILNTNEEDFSEGQDFSMEMM